MPYTNELVPQADIAKHQLLALCQRYARVPLELEWTVDRQRNSYLMEMRSNPQDPRMMEFVFFWDGSLSEELLQLDAQRTPDGQYHLHWTRLPVFSQLAPDASAQAHEDRMAALKEALVCFRSSGLSSAPHVNHVIDFGF